MFSLNLKNATDDNTICATIRMDQKTYQAMRAFMHVSKDSGSTIWFPYGVSLVKRGYGWYHLSAQSNNRAIEKMAFAKKIIRRFLKDEEDKVDEALKFLAPMMMDQAMHAVSFSQETEKPAFGYLGTSQPAKPASPQSLQRLASRFSH